MGHSHTPSLLAGRPSGCLCRSWWIALLLLSLAYTSAGTAVESLGGSKLTLDETIGFRETIKIGKWLPVTVTIRNEGPPVRGLLAVDLSTISEGYPQPYTTTVSQPVDLPTHSHKRYTFVVMFRDFAHPLLIRLTDQAGAGLYSREVDLRTLMSPDRLVLAFSDDPALDSLAGVAPGKARVVYLSLDELPGRWEALDAADLIAFRNVSLGALWPEQMRALKLWLARGGRLLITGGPNWTSYTHPALRELVPVKVTGMVEVTTLQALEPLADMASLTGGRFPILRAEPMGGNVLAEAEGHALITRQRQGRGEAVFMALDPGRAPLSAWDGMPALWKSLFHLDETPNYWKLRRELRDTFEETWVSQLLQLPLLSFPSHLLLAVFLVLYTSTIGFFFWRVGIESLASRDTWMVILLSLLAFSGAAHLLFREQHVQQDALLFEVSTVDVIPQSRFAEIETHLALLSTRKQSYDLTLAGQPATWLQIVPPMARELPLDWHLRQNTTVTIQDTFVPAWGLRVFKGQGMAEFPMESRLLKEADAIMVRVANKTGFVLRHCWLWRGPHLVPLGDLDDGQEGEGILTVSPEEIVRGGQQARWERDLSHEMFKGGELTDLLKRAIVERSMQEVLHSGPGWQEQVMFLGWLDRPLAAISVRPGNVLAQRATLVRMRLPL